MVQDIFFFSLHIIYFSQAGFGEVNFSKEQKEYGEEMINNKK